VAAVAHSLRYDSSATDRGIWSSPYVLFRIWQPCVLGFATENLRYLVTNAQIDAVERTLIHSLQRTLHCFTSPHITMIELGIPPLILQQALQLVALHFRYTVFHTNTITAKLYNLRCQFRCSNSNPQRRVRFLVIHRAPIWGCQALGWSTKIAFPPTRNIWFQESRHARGPNEKDTSLWFRHLRQDANFAWQRQCWSSSPRLWPPPVNENTRWDLRNKFLTGAKSLQRYGWCS